jgi:hypothetical protein
MARGNVGVRFTVTGFKHAGGITAERFIDM